MAKDFNVYQWRREHLNENVDETFSTKRYREDDKINNFTPGEKIDQMSTSFQDESGKDIQIGLNEDIVKKKIKDLTVQDVLGVYLPPTINSTTSEFIDTRDMFDDNWRQARLDRWRKTLYQDSPGSEEWEVNIMKNEINRKVLDWGTEEDAQKYKSAEEKSTRAAQADYAANKGRYQGD
jgi:hypothetical protein